MRIELADVENVIKNEIENGCTQREIAQTYALAIVSSWPTDWKQVNEMIIARWSRQGLEKIKNLAWSGKCFKSKEMRIEIRKEMRDK